MNDNGSSVKKEGSHNDGLLQNRPAMPGIDDLPGQGTWEWDLRSNTMACSKGMYLLFGYHTPEDMKVWDNMGRLFTHHIDRGGQNENDGSWENAIFASDTFLQEMDILAYDGVKRRLEIFGKVFRDEASVAYKVIGITRDITQLRAYERQLDARLAELDRSNKDLEAFAYIASHDLHEPLRKISIFGQRLAQDAAKELSPRNLDYLERMLKATDNMRNLIDNLLEFSRVARDQSGFTSQDLGDVISAVIAEQELLIEETRAKVSVDNMPRIDMIASQVRQLFNNLLNNALKFTKKDLAPDVRVSSQVLDAEEKQRFCLAQDKEYLRISVTDNGIGFEMEQAEKIFQIFHRLNGKSEYAGTGIGLAICRKIVENHRGHIYAESEPGEGARFHVVLPVKH